MRRSPTIGIRFHGVWGYMPVPSWYGLRALGELRLLRVSYAVLIAMPFMAGTLHAWNARVDAAWSERQVAREPHQAAIETELAASLSRGEVPDEMRTRIEEWLRSSRSCTSNSEIDDAVEEAEAHLDDLDGELRGAFRDWLRVARRQAWVPVFLHLRFSPSTKLLFVAMLLISIANAIYSIRCPAELRIVHRPERQGPPHGLGDELDWTISLLKLVQDEDDAIQRITTDVMRNKRGWKPPTPPGGDFDPVLWVEAIWDFYQATHPVSRFLCMALYWSGLGLTVALFLWKTVRIFTV